MYKRLKVKLYPTKNQIEMLENHFDGYRFAYNLSLEYKQVLWKHHRINISGFDLQKELFQIRKEVEWLSKCKAECIRDAGLNVDKTYKNFFRDKSVGFPKFKNKHDNHKSYTTNYTNGNITVNHEKGKIKGAGTYNW